MAFLPVVFLIASYLPCADDDVYNYPSRAHLCVAFIALIIEDNAFLIAKNAAVAACDLRVDPITSTSAFPIYLD